MKLKQTMRKRKCRILSRGDTYEAKGKDVFLVCSDEREINSVPPASSLGGLTNCTHSHTRGLWGLLINKK